MTEFKPMLASKVRPEKLKFPLFVQPKLDGIRCCIVNGKAVTRTLKPVPNAEIRAVLERPEYEGLDGELIVGDPTAEDCYRKTVSFVMSESKTGAEWNFYTFDVWNRTLPFKHSITTTVIRACNLPYVISVATWEAKDAAELEALEAKCVDDGHEGVIVRSPNALYKFGRASATAGELGKIKRFTDSEAVVVGVYEELHNANEATTNALGRTERSSHQENKVGKGTLGGLTVQLVRDHAGFPAGTEFKIGTGFTAEMRAELWQAALRDRASNDGPGEVYGKIAKFKHFECGSKDKPRHPVFLGWRDERDM